MYKNIVSLFVILFLPMVSFSKANVNKEAKTSKGYFFDKALPIGATTEIRILDHDPRFGGIFQIESVKEPGEGLSYTKSGELSKAIKKFDLKKLKD